MPKPPSRNNPKEAKTAANRLRSSSKPIEIKDLLGKKGFGGLLEPRAANQQDSWREFLRSRWGAELDAQVRELRAEQGRLTVYTSSPVWSARLRYALAELWNEISARDPTLKRVDVRVQPAAAKAGGRT
jgi:hypothetical protein